MSRRHHRPPVPLPPIDPEPELIADPYTAYQHRAAAAALPQKAVTGMTSNPRPTDIRTAVPQPASLSPTAEDFIALRQEVSRLAEIVDHQLPEWRELIERYVQGVIDDNARLRVEMQALRAIPGDRTLAIDGEILAFLDKHPGVKFSPTSVAENIGASDNARVASRLARLHELGKIDILAQSGRRPLYFAGVQ